MVKTNRPKTELDFFLKFENDIGIDHTPLHIGARLLQARTLFVNRHRRDALEATSMLYPSLQPNLHSVL